MSLVTKLNPTLFFLDIYIPWSSLTQTSLQILFYHNTKLIDKAQIKNAQARGVYVNSNQATASEPNKTSGDILDHLLNDIDPHDAWRSYYFSRLVLNCFHIVPYEYVTIWNAQCEKLQKNQNYKMCINYNY